MNPIPPTIEPGYDGYYYLHTNGSLHFKKFCPEIEDGGFVRMVWPIVLSDRGNAWVIIVEAGALGADKSRIAELAEKWGLDNDDAFKWARVCGLNLWIVSDGYEVEHPGDLPEAHRGHGKSALDAFIDYARHGDLVSMPPQVRNFGKREN